jgi:hypothetical protein
MLKQRSGNSDAHSGDGLRVMPFGARPASRGVGSGEEPSRGVRPDLLGHTADSRYGRITLATRHTFANRWISSTGCFPLAQGVA